MLIETPDSARAYIIRRRPNPPPPPVGWVYVRV